MTIHYSIDLSIEEEAGLRWEAIAIYYIYIKIEKNNYKYVRVISVQFCDESGKSSRFHKFIRGEIG